MINLEASKEILNLTIEHKVFGTGTITELNENTLTVHFNQVGDKKFVYPDAFDNFLVLCDQTFKKVIDHDNELKKAEIDAEKAHILQKHEDRQAIMNITKNKPKKKTTKQSSNKRA